jgi:hypothetical protein
MSWLYLSSGLEPKGDGSHDAGSPSETRHLPHRGIQQFGQVSGLERHAPMRVNVINAHFPRGTTPRQPIRLQYPVSSGGKRFQRSFLWWAAQGTRTDYP